MIKKLRLLPFLLIFNFLSAQMTVEDSIQKSDFLRQQGDSLYKKGKYLSAAEELKKSLRLKPKTKIYERMDLIYYIAKNYQHSHQLDSAKQYYNLGHSMVCDTMPPKVHYAKNFHLFNFSNIRYQTDSTMHYGLKAYDIAFNFNLKKKQAQISTYLGAFFLIQKNYKKAEKYIIEGHKIAQDINFEVVVHEGEMYLGQLALELGRYAEAEERLKKAATYFDKHGYQNGSFQCKTYLSMVAFYTGRAHETLKSTKGLFKSLYEFEFSNELDDYKKNLFKQVDVFFDETSTDSVRLTNIYNLQKELDTISPARSRIETLKGSIILLLSNKEVLDSINPETSNILQQQISKMVQLQDSLYQNKLKKSYSEYEVKYQTERKQKENEILKRNRDWFIFGIILSIVTLIGFITYAINKRRKISLQNQLKISDARDKESHGIGIELHGKVTRKLAAIADKLTKKNDLETAKYVIFIKDYIRSLSHGLIETKFLEDEFDEQLISIVSDFDTENFKISLKELKNIPWKSINQIVKRKLLTVLEEIIINSKKHSNAKKLDIGFKKKNKKLIVHAIDDGDGFDTDAKHSGKGIQLIKEEISEVNGKAIINSKPNKQTEVKLEITLI